MLTNFKNTYISIFVGDVLLKQPFIQGKAKKFGKRAANDHICL